MSSSVPLDHESVRAAVLLPNRLKNMNLHEQQQSNYQATSTEPVVGFQRSYSMLKSKRPQPSLRSPLLKSGSMTKTPPNRYTPRYRRNNASNRLDLNRVDKFNEKKTLCEEKELNEFCARLMKRHKNKLTTQKNNVLKCIPLQQPMAYRCQIRQDSTSNREIDEIFNATSDSSDSDENEDLNFDDAPAINSESSSDDDDDDGFNKEDIKLRLQATASIDLELDSIDLKLNRIKSIITLLTTNGLLTSDSANSLSSGLEAVKSPIYETVSEETMPCRICLEETYLNERRCCGLRACNPCINAYVQAKIMNCQRKVPMECLNTECQQPITREEINDRMLKFDKQALNIYLNHLNELNSDSRQKTCPKCCTMLKIDEYIAALSKEAVSSGLPAADAARKTNLNALIASSTSLLLKSKKRPSASTRPGAFTKVQCSQCQFVWCFNCHAPWHAGLKCKEYVKGDKLLKNWSREQAGGQINAQTCPKCKVYIQRNSGCDTMACACCNTEFCYKCGGKFRHVKFFGDHYSRLSVLGCKQRFYPDKPIKRKLIRASVFGAKIACIPFLAGAGIVVGACALAASTVVVPAYGSYKIIKLIKTKTDRRNLIRKILEDQETKQRLETDENKINSSLPSSSSKAAVLPRSSVLDNDEQTGSRHHRDILLIEEFFRIMNNERGGIKRDEDDELDSSVCNLEFLFRLDQEKQKEDDQYAITLY